MKNILKIKACGVLLAAGLACSGAAFAQGGNSQLMNGGATLMEKFSASDVTSMFGEFNIQTQLQPYQNDGTASLLAVTEGGAQFIVTMFNCEDVVNALGCNQALIYTGFPSGGLSYDDLNTFHTNADVTRAVNIPAQQIIIFGTQIYAQGGIGRENFQLLSVLFLNDMQNFMNSLAGSTQSVSFNAEKTKRGKTNNVAAGDDETVAPSVAVSAEITKALSAAVSNTRHVEFMSEKAAKFVD